MLKYGMNFFSTRLIVLGGMFAFLFVGGLSIWTQLGHSNRLDQNPGKILEKGDDFDPPIKITLVRSYAGEIEPNKKIFAGDDWLKGLAVRVLNTSDKPVTHVTVELRFRRPKEQAQELDVIHALRYGPDPFFPPESSSYTSPEPILPEKSVDISLADDEYDLLRSVLSQHKYPASLKAIKLRVRTIGFSDGTAWSAGEYFKRDLNNPDKWIRVRQPQAKTSKRNNGFF